MSAAFRPASHLCGFSLFIQGFSAACSGPGFCRFSSAESIALLIRPSDRRTVPHPLRRFYREMGGKAQHSWGPDQSALLPALNLWRNPVVARQNMKNVQLRFVVA